MTRINSNVASLIAQVNLGRSNADLDVRLQRLSTGLQINRGADNPAGLIISERLRSEIRGTEQGILNAERASSVISTAEAALNEVSDLLNSIKALVVESNNTGALSSEEREANQLQVDSAIDAITRIANTSSFGGLKLLNGELDYIASGIDDTNIVKTQINSVFFGNRDTVPVDVEVIGSAQQAGIYLQGTSATLGGGADGVMPATATTFRIAGPDGVEELTFISGQSLNDVIAAVNQFTAATGVVASRASAADISSGIVFRSADYGSGAFVSVEAIVGGGNFNFGRIPSNGAPPLVWAGAEAANRDNGKDVDVIINGAIARGRGLEVDLRTPLLDMSLLLSETFATTVSGTPESFDVIGGGSRFQLGAQVNVQQQVDIGIRSVHAARLGGTFVDTPSGMVLQFLTSLKTGNDNDLVRGDLANASLILESAIDEVTTMRGRLGAFEKNVLQPNVRSLQTALQSLTASESVIRDADFARETSALTRAQILTQAGTSVLATANANAQNVLQLLG